MSTFVTNTQNHEALLGESVYVRDFVMSWCR